MKKRSKWEKTRASHRDYLDMCLVSEVWLSEALLSDDPEYKDECIKKSFFALGIPLPKKYKEKEKD